MMPRKQEIIAGKTVAVAVEGADYFHFLLNHIKDVPEFAQVQLFDFKSISELGEWLRAFRTIESFRLIRQLGVIRDAEENGDSAAQSVRDCLQGAGLAVLAAPMIHAPGTPGTAFLTVPHRAASGCLEDACLLAAADKRKEECAKALIQCVGNGGRGARWTSKALVHAMIAVGPNPAMTLGQSVAVGLWDFEISSLRIFSEFLRILVVPPA